MMEDGVVVNLFDLLSMNGILFNENFQMILGVLVGIGMVFYLYFEVINDGGGEVFVFDNIVVVSDVIFCLVVGEVFINEFYYDNIGGDIGEFIEVVVVNIFGGNVVDLVVMLYNGLNGFVYGIYVLSIFMEGEDDGIYIYYSKVIVSV